MNNTPVTLSTQELADIQYVLGGVPPGQECILDLSDDAHYRFFMRQMGHTGASAKTHPMVFKTIEDSRNLHAQTKPQQAVALADDSPPGLVDKNLITSFGISVSQLNSMSSAMSSIINGTVYTTLMLEIMDLQNNSSLGSQSLGPVYGEGQYESVALKALPPSTSKMRSIYTYSYQATSGQPPMHGTVHFTTDEVPVGQPKVTQPVVSSTHAALPYLKIGIGRTRQNTPADCDYWYNEPDINKPNVRVPMVGSQKFSTAIQTPLFDLTTHQPVNIMAPSIMLTLTNGGTTSILPIVTKDLYKYIWISDTDPQTLVWSFPFNNDVAKDQSTQFGPSAYQESNLMLTCTFAVKTQGSNGDYVFCNIYSSSTGPYSPAGGSDGNYVMMPILSVWHCVAADTLITLADRSTMPITAICGGERVVSDNEGTLFTVVDTFGTTKFGEITELTTEHGHVLKITDMHPVLTDKGYIPPRDLLVGDMLKTDKGLSRLTGKEVQTYEGEVWGFSLGATPEEEARFTDCNTNYYANGILIADNRICRSFAGSYRRWLEAILARLPVEWYDEARSHHAQQSARGK